MALGYTTESYITKLKLIFGDKYDYSKVEYKGSLELVTLICPEHGEFSKKAADLLRGRGCGKCGHKYQSRSTRLTTEEFVNKAREIHGDKYDYSEVEYKSSKDKIKIICPLHGPFYQTPSHHINNGTGCPECSRISKVLSLEEFIRSANIVHNYKYDYSKVTQFLNMYEKVTIICHKHGDFLLTPHSHIHSGCGCPKCRQSHGESTIESYLEKNDINFEKQYKVLLSNCTAFIDFYIPSLNLFIEYNGILHYIPLKYFGGEIKFNQLINRDNELKEYCSKNNINLLEIRYDDNIFNKLTEYVKIN